MTHVTPARGPQPLGRGMPAHKWDRNVSVIDFQKLSIPPNVGEFAKKFHFCSLALSAGRAAQSLWGGRL